MPFEVDWHSALPVLIVTYQGTLTRREYKQLCAERASRLNGGPSSVALLADMREFEGFPEAETMAVHDHPLLSESVRHTVIVLEHDDYKPLFRAVTTDLDKQLAVYFFADIEQALGAASQLIS